MLRRAKLPLDHRRIKLSLQYVTKLKSTPSNPAFNCVFRPEFEQKYMRNTKVIRPLDIRIKEHLEGSNILIEDINDDERQKGGDLTQSYDKSPYTHGNVKRAVTTQTTSQKSSIKQRTHFHAYMTFMISLHGNFLLLL